MKRPTIGIVGAGRLATALAPLLVTAGYRITAVSSATRADARRLARVVRARAWPSSRDVALHAECILLAVPDRALGPTARQLARTASGCWPGKIVLHHAGGLGLEAVAALAARGAEVGVLHPLQTLGDPALARALVPGSRARIEGTPRALHVSRRMARDLGLVPLELRPHARPADRVAYHAAAALAANDLLGLLAVAVRILGSAGVEPHAAERALVRLALGAIAQAERHGLARALTGPVARGDAVVLRAHLEVLGRRAPDAATLHRVLSRQLLALAYPGARRRSATARALGRVLGDRRGPARKPTV